MSSFKDRYTKAIDPLYPTRGALEKTAHAMHRAANPHPKTRRPALRIAAIALCAVLLAAGIGGAVLLSKKPPQNPVLTHTTTPVPTPKTSPEAPLSPAKPGVGNYAFIYKHLRANGWNAWSFDDYVQGTIPAPGADSGMNGSSVVSEHSDTNNQVAGVQEADIVKTDGNYIYACNLNAGEIELEQGYTRPKQNIGIFSVQEGRVARVSTIAPTLAQGDCQLYLADILLSGDTLVVVSASPMYAWYAVDAVYGDYGFGGGAALTVMEIYDIADRTAPVLVNTLSQSGRYTQSRLVDGCLYMVSTHNVYTPIMFRPESFIPKITADGQSTLIPAEAIYCPPGQQSSSYTVITGTKLDAPQAHASSVALLGDVYTLYASQNNLYIAGIEGFAPDNTATAEDEGSIFSEKVVIHRFAYDNGIVAYAATGEVRGQLINQFAMDEHEGALRVATTINAYRAIKRPGAEDYDIQEFLDPTSGMTILDMDLCPIGSVTGLAPGERIYSVRFDGDIGYMVTFRQVDPLFAIDLSDATAPKVLSALKIPGVSTYMHAYGEGLLFGIGMAGDDQGRIGGLKLAMFDVTDKANVTQKASVGLGEGYSAALYNHKAILIDPAKNLIGIPFNAYNGMTAEYIFFTWDGTTFVQQAKIPISVYTENTRGLYIGNHAYIITPGETLASYDMTTFSLVESCQIN